MVNRDYVYKQIKDLGFKIHGWGKTEVHELPNIILPDENIHELVNGFYEGGFALLVATDVRVLLIDKKPLNYLTVEDLRFDMINEMDYSHRLIGAQISIATGNKTLKFTSLNQPRLRKLIGHVQHSMADTKKQMNSHQEDQKQHLEEINQQLRAYLVAQHQYQLEVQRFQSARASGQTAPEPPKPVQPSPELSDFLYAQSLLAQHQAMTGGQQLPAGSNQPEQPAAQQPTATPAPAAPAPQTTVPAPVKLQPSSPNPAGELYAAGVEEIFGKHSYPAPPQAAAQTHHHPVAAAAKNILTHPLEINPMRIAYSKLPMALRNRKFGRPSFHAHTHNKQLPGKPMPQSSS